MVSSRFVAVMCAGLACSCVVPERIYTDDAATLDATLTDAALDGASDATSPAADADSDKDAAQPADAQGADAHMSTDAELMSDAYTPDTGASEAGADVGTSPPDSGNGNPDASSDTGMPCTATGPEDCFNGLDDDCNNAVDCADTACLSGTMCVPTSDVQGVMVAADEGCPVGYQAGETMLSQGLSGEPCSGCRCEATPTQCGPASAYFYTVEGDCDLDTHNTGGGYATIVAQTTCPPSTPAFYGFTYGYRVDSIAVLTGTGTCSPTGTGSPGAVSWAQTAKFCTAEAVGAGCDSGYACVATADAGTSCSETRTSCPSGTDEQTWYEDFSDGRSCDACECGGAGDCNTLQVQLGSDWGCDGSRPSVAGGQKNCAVQSYSPPTWLVGAATDPVCTASANTLGDLTPVGPHTLCCSR